MCRNADIMRYKDIFAKAEGFPDNEELEEIKGRKIKGCGGLKVEPKPKLNQF
jgi:hypothetical protein